MKYPKLEPAAYWQYLRHGIINRVFDIYNYKQSILYPEECKIIMSAYNDNRSSIFSIITFRERLLLLLIQYFPSLYIWLRNVRQIY